MKEVLLTRCCFYAGPGLPKTVFNNYTKDLEHIIDSVGGADIQAFIVHGVVVGAMKRQGKEGEFRSNLHQSSTASIIKLSDEEENTALRSAKAMGLGIAGVDMLQYEKGPLVLEVNS